MIQHISWISVFFSPGILLSYLLFPKTDIIKRSVYSVALASSVATIIGLLLYLTGTLTLEFTFWTYLTNIFFLLLSVVLIKKNYETTFNKDFLYLLLLSLIGTLWKFWFLISIQNFSSPYEYAKEFIGKTTPDLGFYHGMAADRASYIGFTATQCVFNFFSINDYLLPLLPITFLYVGFLYIVFSEFRNRRMALAGATIMALGPIELFHATLSFSGHSLSYISLFPLFLLFKSKDFKGLFFLSLLSAMAMMTVYYTGTMAMLLCSAGFIAALIIKKMLQYKNLSAAIKNALTDKKIWSFLIIMIVLAGYTFLFSSMMSFTIDISKNAVISKIGSDLAKGISGITSTSYKDPSFLGLSAIRWQIIFFFLCGFISFLFIVKKKLFTQKNIDLLLCSLPVILISYAFLSVKLPARIFDYFAFFGLLLLQIPKKFIRKFTIIAFIFIVVTGFFVAKDKKVFFEISKTEMAGAKWASCNLKGKIFSDEVFINQLILNNYYSVDGAADENPLVYNLFYQTDPIIFQAAIDELKTNDIEYITLTDRMLKKYILMVNQPQKHLITLELFEKKLKKIFDNHDVRIYLLD